MCVSCLGVGTSEMPSTSCHPQLVQPGPRHNIVPAVTQGLSLVMSVLTGAPSRTAAHPWAGEAWGMQSGWQGVVTRVWRSDRELAQRKAASGNSVTLSPCENSTPRACRIHLWENLSDICTGRSFWTKTDTQENLRSFTLKGSIEQWMGPQWRNTREPLPTQRAPWAGRFVGDSGK